MAAVLLLSATTPPAAGSGTAGLWATGPPSTVAANTDANPQFVAKDSGNFRLSARSPCVNTGTNQNWMMNAVDLEGRKHIRYGRVDMGAYELIYDGSIYTVH